MPKKHQYKYTDQQVFESALRYSTRTQWFKNEASFYAIAKRRGIFEGACGHMIKPQTKKHPVEQVKKQIKTAVEDQEILESALKYRFRTDWIRAEPKMYGLAKDRGIYSVACAHMPVRKKIALGTCRKYSIEELKIEALKYSTRKDFGVFSRNYYVAAQRYGVLSEICQHMPQWMADYDRKFLYFLEDSQQIYIGITSDFHKRFRDHAAFDKLDTSTLYVRKSKFSYPFKIAQRMEKALIRKFKRSSKLKVLNKSSGGELGSQLKYTKNHILRQANLCSTYKIFRKKFKAEHSAAQRRGILNQVKETFN